MTLDLTDEEIAAFARLPSKAIDDDRYPLSPRIQALKAILAKIRPEPVREPLPPLTKQYAPPRATASETAGGTLSCPDETQAHCITGRIRWLIDAGRWSVSC